MKGWDTSYMNAIKNLKDAKIMSIYCFVNNNKARVILYKFH